MAWRRLTEECSGCSLEARRRCSISSWILRSRFSCLFFDGSFPWNLPPRPPPLARSHPAPCLSTASHSPVPSTASHSTVPCTACHSLLPLPTPNV